MLVEVIAPVAPTTPAVPLPDPNTTLDIPPIPAGKQSPLRFVFAGGLLFCVLNLFGIFFPPSIPFARLARAEVMNKLAST